MNRRIEITQGENGYTVKRTDGEHAYDDLLVYTSPEYVVRFLLGYFTPEKKWIMPLEDKKTNEHGHSKKPCNT